MTNFAAPGAGAVLLPLLSSGRHWDRCGGPGIFRRLSGSSLDNLADGTTDSWVGRIFVFREPTTSARRSQRRPTLCTVTIFTADGSKTAAILIWRPCRR